MKRFYTIAAACVGAALFASCGGSNGLSPSTSLPSAQTGAVRALPFGQTSLPPVKYKQLYRFKGTPDGASPFAGLTLVNGTLYGTTLNGSSNYCSVSCGSNECYLGCGTVFTTTTSGAESVVYNFKGGFNDAGDGSWPFAGLTVLNGVLYGTTSSAGANGHGTVFKVNAAGKETVLYSFKGGSDGSGPEAGLTAMNGKLYGTTLSGGGSGCGGSGCGAVFEVTKTGTERVVYSFNGGSDGDGLYSGVTALNGKLYGATLFGGGGAGCGSRGCGTIFSVTVAGKEHVLYRFNGGTTDGGNPNGLTAFNGMLYGTTEDGGLKNSGMVFSVSTSGQERNLYAFQDNPDGNGPGANLIVSNGALYGTTIGGGTTGNGTVFRVSPSGKERVLYSFQGGTDGLDPQSPLLAIKNKLYGTTNKGGETGCGSTGCGTIFEVTI
jgi:uncharacterized repeat protein (TIGR03803 family)